MNPVDILRNPKLMLPRFGFVQDIRVSAVQRYDPYAITHRLHAEMLDYFADPPRNPDGATLFTVLLGSRQTGKSTSPEYCCYVKTAYSPGWDHVTIADNQYRADYLHGRVHLLHRHWDEAIRTPLLNGRERRSMTFEPTIGGTMRVLSGESEAVSIGQSPDSYHASEVPFWADAPTQFSLLWPSLIQKRNALVVCESTPAPPSAPSMEFWQEMCNDAKMGRGRYLYKFYPFWDGKENRRPWPIDWVATLEELRLMERYGTEGLTLENLAFRRLMLDTDSEFRRHPELFGVFYPFDDESCWLRSSGVVFPAECFEKVDEATLVRHGDGYVEFKPPVEGGVYVIGVDPCGSAARDHASFQVLEVWDGRWEQVATFNDHVDPLKFSEVLLTAAKRYGATLFIESTGVGEATIALVRQAGWSKLYWTNAGKTSRTPGVPASQKMNAKLIGYMIDALKDELVLHSMPTLMQLRGYQQDKLVEDSERAEMLRGKIGRRRRERHHWDAVSALMLAVFGARLQQQRRPPAGVGGGAGQVLAFPTNVDRAKLRPVPMSQAGRFRPVRSR